MRHECTCGFELAPEEGREPVGAISHGLCAPCVARFRRDHRPFWYPIRINGYEVRLLVRPGRQAPHVAMDSPQYWEGARPIRVLEARVSRDGVELDPAEFHDLLALARERANVSAPGGIAGRSRSASSQLHLRLNGLLRTAMERTGYQPPELGGVA